MSINSNTAEPVVMLSSSELVELLLGALEGLENKVDFDVEMLVKDCKRECAEVAADYQMRCESMRSNYMEEKAELVEANEQTCIAMIEACGCEDDPEGDGESCSDCDWGCHQRYEDLKSARYSLDVKCEEACQELREECEWKCERLREDCEDPGNDLLAEYMISCQSICKGIREVLAVAGAEVDSEVVEYAESQCQEYEEPARVQ